MRKSVATFIMFFVTLAGSAQVPDLDKFLQSGTRDATMLMDAYMEPVGRAMGATMANGWYNTARTHAPLRFDASLMSSTVYIPDDMMFFSPGTLDLENVILVGPQDGRVPTVVGNAEIVSEYLFDNDGIKGSFTGPAGIGVEERFGMQAMPVPVVQFGIGIVKNTDIKLRFTPEMSYRGVKFRSRGGAVMHSISQYISPDAPSRYDVSVLVGYNEADMYYGLAGKGSDQVDIPEGTGWIRSKGWTAQGIVSRSFEGITVYAGAGYYRAGTDMELDGTYILLDENDNLIRTLVDPVSISYTQSSPRLTAGMQLEFAVITLHADYTFQNYNSLTFGLGLRVDWKRTSVE